MKHDPIMHQALGDDGQRYAVREIRSGLDTQAISAPSSAVGATRFELADGRALRRLDERRLCLPDGSLTLQLD